jgi:DNA-binding NarL/FixJ family response regulator
MQKTIRIAIADDHPIVRKGLREVIEEQPDLAVVGEAGDGASGLALIRELRPDVAILDLHMPKLDGFAVAQEIRKSDLPVSIIFLTLHAEVDLLHRALEVGGKGYVLKDSALVDIVNAVNSVAAGIPFVSPSLTATLLSHRSDVKAFEGKQPGLRDLTVAERRILAMIATGKPTKVIAAELHVHPRTVETHRGSICHKLGLSGANSLLRFALEHKSDLLS